MHHQTNMTQPTNNTTYMGIFLNLHNNTNMFLGTHNPVSSVLNPFYTLCFPKFVSLNIHWGKENSSSLSNLIGCCSNNFALLYSYAFKFFGKKKEKYYNLETDTNIKYKSNISKKRWILQWSFSQFYITTTGKTSNTN